MNAQWRDEETRFDCLVEGKRGKKMKKAFCKYVLRARKTDSVDDAEDIRKCRDEV